MNLDSTFSSHFLGVVVQRTGFITDGTHKIT